MQTDYYIDDEEVKANIKPVADRLALIAELMTTPASRTATTGKELGRNFLTRTLDVGFALVRKYAPPVHWLGAALTATTLFLYVRLVAFTGRLLTMGEIRWPDVPAPCVLALWHRDAPSLLVAFAKRRPSVRSVIMIARDPRGDCLTLLCRMLGLRVVRGGGEEGGWNALIELAEDLVRGACVIITADGGGPARVAKVGAVALAAAVSVPLVPLAADCYPAIQEHHKWDAARNPLLFSSVLVSLGPARSFEPFVDPGSIEQARKRLEEALNRASFDVVVALHSL